MSVNRETEELPFVTPVPVPANILAEIREELWTRTVTVFTEEGSFRGTATCVRTGGRDCLLTAAHVWDGLKNRQRFHVSLDTDRLLIPVETLLVQPRLLRDKEWSEWGPDVALIELPPVDASSVKLVKAFYDLDKPRLPERVDQMESTWVLVGVPEEGSYIEQDAALMRVTAYSPSEITPRDLGEYDYIDISFSRVGIEGLPSFFGGISGSGLWEIPFMRSDKADGFRWNRTVILRGLAFYQPKGQSVVRCHGPKTINRLVSL